ncbi:hypothetical protein ENTCAN_07777 [Enterobacter cancerogenus ATCC 35316]|nr:hypothetical protein ENTCAN_07777 [Enterobacter cancerogenus ATCC 35316]
MSWQKGYCDPNGAARKAHRTKGDVFLTVQGRIKRFTQSGENHVRVVEESGIRRDHGTSSDGYHPRCHLRPG